MDAAWRKASYSNNGGNCVEAGNGDGTVLIRDTTDRDGVMLRVPPAAWTALLASVKAG